MWVVKRVASAPLRRTIWLWSPATRATISAELAGAPGADRNGAGRPNAQ